VELLRALCVQQKRYGLLYWPRILTLALFIAGFSVSYPVWGWQALLWTMPLSLFLELLIYLVLLPVTWQWKWTLPQGGALLKTILPVSLGWAVFYCFMLVDNYFLAWLPTGDPSAFRYASISTGVIGNLTVANIALQQIPGINLACSQQQYHTVLQKLSSVFRYIALGSVPLMLLVFLVAPVLIKTMFQRGSFNAEDTLRVVHCFRITIFMIPYHALWRSINGCYYSLRVFKPFLCLGAGIVLLRIAMDALGVYVGGVLGLSWFAVANSYLLIGALAFYLVFYLRRKHKLLEQHS
jgi:peptidoglycan biosynthesis protein MviN/MurJ (putative lipid II flippase)